MIIFMLVLMMINDFDEHFCDENHNWNIHINDHVEFDIPYVQYDIEYIVEL